MALTDNADALFFRAVDRDRHRTVTVRRTTVMERNLPEALVRATRSLKALKPLLIGE